MADPWAAFRVQPAPAASDDPWSAFRSAADNELTRRKLRGMSEDELRAASYVQPAPPPGVTIHGAKGDVFVNRDGKQVPTTPAEGQARMLRERDGIAGDVADSVLRGVPFAGEFLPRARAGFNAAVRGEDYAKNLEQEQARARTFDEDNRVASMAGKVAGGIGGTVAALPMMAQAGAGGAVARALLGGGAGSAVGAVGRGALAGALQGTAQGVGQSQDLTNVGDTAKNAAWSGGFGAGLGALIPGAVALGVGGKNWLNNMNRDALSSVPKQGAKFLQDQLGDPAAIASVQARMRDLGPDAVMADASQEMMGIAHGAAAIPGTRATVVDKLLTRDAGKNARINATVDAELGPAPIPSQVKAGIEEGQQALGPMYGEKFQGASAVNTQPLADTLDASAVNLRGPAQKAVNQVRGFLDIPGARGNLDPNPQALFQTRQAIDGMLTNEQNPQVIRQLTIARQQVDDQLAQAVPGIKDVDAYFQELARQKEGLQRGGQVFDSGKTAIRPQELTDEITQGANPSGTLVGPSATPVRMRQGARADLDRIIGTNANDVAKLNQVLKNEGDWNRDKLRALFGQDKADRLLKVLDNERVMEATTRRVTGGSDTAPKTEFAAFIKGLGVPMKVPVETSLVGGGLRGGQKLLQALTQGRGEQNAQQVADALARLSVSGGSEADALIRALMTRTARQRAGKAANEAAGKFAAPLSSPLLRALMDDSESGRTGRRQ